MAPVWSAAASPVRLVEAFAVGASPVFFNMRAMAAACKLCSASDKRPPVGVLKRAVVTSFRYSSSRKLCTGSTRPPS